MSSTLVESPVSTLHLPGCTRQPIEDVRRSPSHEGSIEAQLIQVAQLVVLASQHHTSEYNRLKYGPTGSPMLYVPFSIQMPSRVKQLQEHQARCVEQQAWWLCEKKVPVQSVVMVEVESDPLQPRLRRPSSSNNLQDELTAAMSESLPRNLRPIPPMASDVQIKTSDTHPINVSMVIPFEVLQAMSSQLIRTDDRHPVMFELSSTYSLDRISVHTPTPPPEINVPALPTPQSTLLSTSAPASSATSRPPIYSLTRPTKFSHFLWTNAALRRGLYSAVNTHAKRVRPKPTVPNDCPCGSSDRGLKSQPRRSNGPQRPLDSSGSNDCEKGEDCSLPRSLSAPVSTDLKQPPLAAQPVPPELASTSLPDLSSSYSSSQQPSVSLGNLLLSSCPGKKVRLSGPVKGRCGVCRDLRQDMQRIKEFGVTCIVCCLDDEELQLLGVSWSEYWRIADEMGIDILRIPTPEGLVPASLDTFDAQLTLLIQQYTLHGASVLVHCRGGVGRAGLIACCWVLKLGLCGGVEAEAPSTIAYTAPENLPELKPSRTNPDPPSASVNQATIQLVERVIVFIRRRRSPKAIETYEQVQFLVDYVEFLRKKTNAATDSEFILDWDTQID
ncbi:uncharacterized protein FIBRA_02732 [Fibroporia radiculosa]|uniref:Tyrosine specific protein phosphatases domain-containing protein n=1 Tax=Fibroporia radiculosa TaxID=599839 RepID=J4G2I8_9APHY|nr:uncharacterized protein FIBRA_02732 [Fibroporia radiculosa]CCM00693.1 predicted protein [Fibroporia radiculosa]